MARYTQRQAAYLTFIYFYTAIHGRSPAEHEFLERFRVSGPAVHQMIVTLTRNGLITREPYVPRSIRLNLNRDELRELLGMFALEQE